MRVLVHGLPLRARAPYGNLGGQVRRSSGMFPLLSVPLITLVNKIFPMKDKTTAGILALLLGALGVHRFYLSQPGYGILYLLFCWTFVPVVVSIIDGIIFLTMDVDAFNKKYNGGKSMPGSAGVNTADELEKLHALKEKGAITTAEYDARKAKLL